VIKFSIGSDWDLFGDQSREIETRNYEKDNYIQALIVELYLHVSSVNHDDYPVMIDRISMLKYQRLQSTIAHEYWRRRMMEAASVMEWALAKRTPSVWIFWCDCWQWSHLSWSCANGPWRRETSGSSKKLLLIVIQRNQSVVDHHYRDELSSAPLRFG